MTELPVVDPPAAADPSAMSGLEQMRALATGAFARRGIGVTLGFRIAEVEEGRVVFAGTPDEAVYNPIGTVHGGYAATLLDSACGCACHSRLPAGQGYTTLELKVAYHRPITAATGEVFAEGRVTHFGRRTAYAEATLKDAAGRLLASATSTLMVLDR